MKAGINGLLGSVFPRLAKKSQPVSIDGAEEQRNLALRPVQTKFHDISMLNATGLRTTKTNISNNYQLVDRIIRAYHRSQDLTNDEESFWSNHYSGLKLDIHQALMRGNLEEVGNILGNPASNDLFFGFDSPCLKSPASCLDPQMALENEIGLYDHLMRLAEATGAMRLPNPEGATSPVTPISVDEILDRIEEATKENIDFPNPYPGEEGLESRRGVISWRPIQSIYQALTIKQAVDCKYQIDVLEIGAGLGRTAYYASHFGVRSYSIVDIPLTCAAQAYFLGRSIGPDNIVLHGEDRVGAIRIMPPQALLSLDARFDVAINVDSFTEMSRETVISYLDAISVRAPVLISINHEHNYFTVRELVKMRPGWKIERRPYWLRNGYVEEIIRF